MKMIGSDRIALKYIDEWLRNPGVEPPLKNSSESLLKN